MKLRYVTRDGEGHDIEKEIEVKEFKTAAEDFVCPFCHKAAHEGPKIKDCVSANFTDWGYVDGAERICVPCSRLMSLYFYSYSVEAGEIHVFNIREIKEHLLRAHKTPFKFIITKSRKKHLFYRAIENESDKRFAVQLETETIFTTRQRQEKLFDFVECMMVLGQSKTQMEGGEIRYEVFLKTGNRPLRFLRRELERSREIMIPLYCAQKPEISEEEALCKLDSMAL